jgi:hypothetical protein
MRPKLCNKCNHLWPPEGDGRRQTAKHMCRVYNTEVFHHGCQPWIFRIPGCMEYEQKVEESSKSDQADNG